MSGESVPLTSIRRVVIAIPLLFVTSLSAQSDKPIDVNPEQIAVDDGHGDKAAQGSQNSFKLLQRQSVIQCFEIIRQAIDRKDYLAALPLIERVLSESNSFVPTLNATDVSSHEEVRRLLETMPVEIRQRFDEPRRIPARRDWSQAREQGIEAVRQFLQQYSDSSFAVDAWWWIGCHQRDVGKWTQAATAFERSARHPKASVRQRAVSLLATMEWLLSANLQDEAARVHSKLVTLDANLAIEFAGKSTTLGRLLDEPPFKLATRQATNRATELTSAADEWQRQRPVLLPVWKQEFIAPLLAEQEALELRQRDQGIRPVPLVRPMIVGQQIIARTLDEIRSYDLSTGQTRWAIANTEFRPLEKRKQNGVSLSVATEWAQRRSEADSIFARMSTDGRRLFAIQEPDRASEFRIERETPRGILRTGPRFNKLCGYSLETGALEWQVGDSPAENSETLAGFVFLGAPLLLDDLLFIVAQRDTDLSLLAIEPDSGELNFSMSLGTASLPIDEDLQRSRVACPIVWHDGMLICSTSSGAVVAVDPTLRILKWGYRFPATTVSAGDLAQVPGPTSNSIHQEIWWEMWREPFAAVAQLQELNSERIGEQSSPNETSVYLFCSPESDRLHCLRLPDGEPLWQVSRNEGLFVAGVVTNLVVVIEGDAARAHDLRTGRQRWRTPIGEVSGPAALVGNIVVLPVRSGGTVLLDARDGQILSESTMTDSPIGTLSETEAGWIAFQRQSLMLLPRLGEVRRRVDLELHSDPDNESLLVRAALLDLQAGDAEAARQRLAGLTSSPARDLRRQALVAALSRSGADYQETIRADLARELTELAENADYKFAAGAAIGTSALAVNDLVATVDASLAGLSADLDPDDALVRRSTAIVRKDRILLGLIDAAYRRAKPEELVDLDELFNSRLKLARKSRDRSALQQLAEQWRGIDWGRRLIVTDEEKSLRKRSFFETESRLLDAAGSADESIALQALDRLSQRYDRQSMVRESRAVRQRILRELPATRFPDGETEAERIARDPVLRESVSGVLAPIWPATSPIVDPPQKDRNFGVYCPLIPMHAEPGSLAERLDVAIDRSGSDVIFRGETFFQIGEDEEHERKFPLPKTMSAYRGPSGHMLREGWGVGRIVVLLVGSELFAIAPLDEQEQPNSRFLWAHPIDLQLPLSGTKMVPGRAGIHDQRHLVVDDLNRPIARIGPVRASYLCYQTGTRLVAVETQTGRQLWQRLDLPAGATVLGDDQEVYVWRDAKSLEVFSAIDGRKLRDAVWFASPDSMIHHRGSLVWTASRGEHLQIELRDLKTGRLVWSRSDDVKSLLAVLDMETLAIVTPDRSLLLMAARTGEALCPTIEVNSESMTEIVAWHDAEQWYIALSRTIENLATLNALQPNGGYGQRFLDGPLYAVNRHEPRLMWQRELTNEPIALAQSRNAPLIIQLWKSLPKGNLDASQGLLRVVDRRTGTELYKDRSVDILPYFLLNSDPQQAIVELKLTHQTIRFRYVEDEANARDELAKPAGQK